MQLARILFLVRSSLHVQPPSPSRAPAAHSPPAGTEYHSPAIGMPLAPFGSGFRPTVRYIREPVGPHDVMFETMLMLVAEIDSSCAKEDQMNHLCSPC